MFYLERLHGETREQLCAWVENQLHEFYPERAEQYAGMLRDRPVVDWPGIVRAGREFRFRGRTFCEIESFGMTIRVLLRFAAEGGRIPRDHIKVGRMISREDFSRLAAGTKNDGRQNEVEEPPKSPTFALLYHCGVGTEIDPMETDPPVPELRSAMYLYVITDPAKAQ
ncbi:hypothetical protein ACFL2Z_03165 [Candidatus Eisenbacteria bacterium]|uniref:Uncharacterized protein n=1 Tax=Eiseniibacteriota bacterium TaxID=2212470 RepID=A0ABV6YP81_UNCEI